MKRKLFFCLLVLALIVIAAISAWHIYVSLQEDTESVRTYADLTAYVHLPDITLLSTMPEGSQFESTTSEETAEPPE